MININVGCPVCNKHVFTEEFELCPVCEWQFDKLQYKDHMYWGGLNKLCVNDYKAQWTLQINEETAKKKLQDFVERGGSWLEIAK